MTQTLDQKIAAIRAGLDKIAELDRTPDTPVCVTGSAMWAHIGHCKPETVRAILDALDEARRHVEVLQEKISAETNCACGYDTPDDVCAVHSPALKAVRAENERLREALPPLIHAAHNMTGALVNAWQWLKNVRDGHTPADKAEGYVHEANNKAIEAWYPVDRAARAALGGK